MSPKIPFTTPIASSMSVLGVNIVVGNATSQTSSTWSIPNFSVTPIPPNTTNKQINVSERPGHTPEISLKANPQSKFTQDFLLNTGWNLVVPRIPLGKVNSKPSIFKHDLSFMWTMKSRLMAGSKKDHWKMLLGVDFGGKSGIDTSEK
ncbi:hypothetical protein O181_107973 [Austropuccinia psidii MF-1]|uniref:Uncharacterized protein n=1 Tax=Austropuccinia psidii MF-1 TaxID=1389203 RepID=A0A9Q3JTH5_9BASI|nr:hypothetical protein [Austropuccinia psidii MF-1]